MTSTVLLRYREIGDATIAAHLEMIGKHRQVWWGWWKKGTESDQAVLLDALGDKCPLVIGLFDRSGSDEYYVAQCASVRRSDETAGVVSPEPQFTPLYYRNEPVAAWFCLTNISRIPLDDFKRRFGGVPRGEATLYEVCYSDDGPRILNDNPTLTCATKPIGGPGILHLTDIHFGAKHGFAITVDDGNIGRERLIDVLKKYFAEHERPRIGLVIVSGDLITRAETRGYGIAYDFLSQLLTVLSLTADDVVIVPGNHDIKVGKNSRAMLDYRHEQPYRRFVSRFYGRSIEALDGVWWFEEPGGWRISVVGLNSARLRSVATKEYGYIGRDRFGPLLEKVREEAGVYSAAELFAQRRLNLAVVHHHVVPAAPMLDPEVGRPMSLTLDAGEFVTALQRTSIHCLLHGHQHYPFVGSVARTWRGRDGWKGLDESIYVLGGGSLGAEVSDLPEEARGNFFGVYSPQADGLHVKIVRIGARGVAERYLETLLTFSTTTGVHAE